MSEFGERLDLPLSGSGEAVCRHTAARYLLDGRGVRKLGDR
jgi:UDP-2-acetamido-3-amino-2,3-dideoxy-glucuronate N-acetyltransferase